MDIAVKCSSCVRTMFSKEGKGASEKKARAKMDRHRWKPAYAFSIARCA